MKYLKKYGELLESSGTLTQEQLDWLNECSTGKWTLNPQTGLVDIKGSFVCSKKSLRDFKGIKFGTVSEDFYCSVNALSSLRGAPREVGRDFYCSINPLTSLIGSPQKVGRDFYCDHNSLTSLKGSPREIGRQFFCRNNSLTTLKGAPQEVGGSFYCDHNSLSSLEGAPQEVGGNFWCESNSLISLEGAPLEIGGDFHCEGNPVSEKTLNLIWTEMQEGYSYPEALKRLILDIPTGDWNLLDKTGLEMDDPLLWPSIADHIISRGEPSLISKAKKIPVLWDEIEKKMGSRKFGTASKLGDLGF